MDWPTSPLTIAGQSGFDEIYYTPENCPTSMQIPHRPSLCGEVELIHSEWIVITAEIGVIVRFLIHKNRIILKPKQGNPLEVTLKYQC